MKRFFVKCMVILVVVLTIGIFAFIFISSSNYNRIANSVRQSLLKEVPYSAETVARLKEIESEWQAQSSGLAAAEAEGLKSLGRDANVAGLIDLLQLQPLPFDPWDRDRNSRSLEIMQVQRTLMPIAIDSSIHVSEDRTEALIWLIPISSICSVMVRTGFELTPLSKAIRPLRMMNLMTYRSDRRTQQSSTMALHVSLSTRSSAGTESLSLRASSAI